MVENFFEALISRFQDIYFLQQMSMQMYIMKYSKNFIRKVGRSRAHNYLQVNFRGKADLMANNMQWQQLEKKIHSIWHEFEIKIYLIFCLNTED